MNHTKKETPEALAARIAADYFAALISGSEPDYGELESGIDELYAALSDDPENDKNLYVFGRASYMVGVQVGLRLRNVGDGS